MFPDATCRSDIAEPKEVANLIRLILVLLWSGTSRPKWDHKGTSSRRCVPAGKMSRSKEEQTCSQIFTVIFIFQFFSFSVHFFSCISIFRQRSLKGVVHKNNPLNQYHRKQVKVSNIRSPS